MRAGYYDMANKAIVDLFDAGKMDDKIAIITRVKVHRANRGKGYASALMQKVIAEADEEGSMLILAVEGYDGGLSNEQLVEWYSRLGFVLMKEADLSLPDLKLEPAGMVMVRQPRSLDNGDSDTWSSVE